MDHNHVSTGNVTFGNDLPLALIAGPCQMESRDHALEMAAACKDLSEKLGIGFVFKSSFDKANRTSLSGKRGLGLDKALGVFSEIKDTLGVPVLTDVHEALQCKPVAEGVEIRQGLVERDIEPEAVLVVQTDAEPEHVFAGAVVYRVFHPLVCGDIAGLDFPGAQKFIAADPDNEPFKNKGLLEPEIEPGAHARHLDIRRVIGCAEILSFHACPEKSAGQPEVDTQPAADCGYC